MRKQWRCFHCDTVFTNVHEAGIHFGADMAGTCACVLPHEQHLVEHIRDLERQLDSYRDDRDRIMRSIMTLEADHRQAVVRAEEEGYGRGVRDMRKECEQQSRCSGACLSRGCNCEPAASLSGGKSESAA